MDLEIQNLVQAIHDRPGRTLVVTAGAGAQALAWLLGVAGASRTLIEAVIPYHEAAFIDFLGHRPEQHVADTTSGLLAGKALTRAKALCTIDEPVYGLACTATIVTDRPKRGQHRAHITVWAEKMVSHYYIGLKKGARDREGEEELVSRVILNALGWAMDIDRELSLPLLASDRFTRSDSNLAMAAEELIQGKNSSFGVSADGRILQRPKPRVVLSGAFNPLHQGHLKLAEVSGNILEQPVMFELAAHNVEKGDLTIADILSRLSQFAGKAPVATSRASTFDAKSRLYPNSTFIVGIDTAVRILQPRYYGNSREKMLAALEQIQDNGCQFLVAGRADDNGVFQDAAILDPPAPFGDLFLQIPEEQFRFDLSSTKLRNTQTLNGC